MAQVECPIKIVELVIVSSSAFHTPTSNMVQLSLPILTVLRKELEL